MNRLVFLLSTLLFFPLAAHAQEEAVERFVVYYDQTAPIEAFEPYDLVVLDSDHHPNLKALKEHGKTLLGYISLGEVETYRSYFKAMKAAGLVLHENNNWKGSHFVDIRNPAWAKAVIEDLIPRLLAQGFDGIFIDTMDSPLELERVNPMKFKGMQKAEVALVKAIRSQYPDIKIMLNRAYPLLPEVGGQIDYVLGESVYYDYDFNTKTYKKVKSEDYQEQVAILKEAGAKNPNLGIYTLDYAEKKDTSAIRDIYKTQRKNGFIPYVSTVKLNEIVAEPGS